MGENILQITYGQVSKTSREIPNVPFIPHATPGRKHFLLELG